MTDNEINQAIAEACGWTDLEIHQPTAEFPEQDPPPFLRGHKTPNGLWMRPPNYVADLNACHEFEKSLSRTERQSYVQKLKEVTGSGGSSIMWQNEIKPICATARQRCEAFLRLKRQMAQR